LNIQYMKKHDVEPRVLKKCSYLYTWLWISLLSECGRLSPIKAPALGIIPIVLPTCYKCWTSLHSFKKNSKYINQYYRCLLSASVMRCTWLHVLHLYTIGSRRCLCITTNTWCHHDCDITGPQLFLSCIVVL
jgi:hypothetical protein